LLLDSLLEHLKARGHLEDLRVDGEQF